ncbi:MAG: glycosyltransferase family 2 protein [Desulfovibrio sp.]|nr:glycosyltransferase family 2 protein [Desulfovibrio sp.]
MKKVTVAIPTYNDEKYINEAIDSILNQTFKDFLLLIIDDGSNDSTYKIISKYRDTRIHIIKNDKNLGRGLCRNIALNCTDSEYLAWMDGDDISHPQRLEKQVVFMDENPDISISGTGMILLGQKNITTKPITKPSIISALTIFKPAIANATAIMRLNDIKSNKLQYDSELLRAEDFAFWAQSFLDKELQGNNIIYPLYYYRVFNRINNEKWHRRVIDKYIGPILKIKYTEKELNIHNFFSFYSDKNIFQFYELSDVFLLIKKLQVSSNLFSSKVKYDILSIIDNLIWNMICRSEDKLKCLKKCKEYEIIDRKKWNYFFIRLYAKNIKDFFI